MNRRSRHKLVEGGTVWVSSSPPYKARIERIETERGYLVKPLYRSGRAARTRWARTVFPVEIVEPNNE